MVMTAAESRARDALGRPLGPDAEGVVHGVDVDAPRSGAQALATAQQLLDDGFPFAAHEVLEARWKHCPARERALWQGLAQACVALTHAARGNLVGAQRLLARCRLTLADADPAAWTLIGLESAGIELWISESLNVLSAQQEQPANLPRLNLAGR